MPTFHGRDGYFRREENHSIYSNDHCSAYELTDMNIDRICLWAAYHRVGNALYIRKVSFYLRCLASFRIARLALIKKLLQKSSDSLCKARHPTNRWVDESHCRTSLCVLLFSESALRLIELHSDKALAEEIMPPYDLRYTLLRGTTPWMRWLSTEQHWSFENRWYKSQKEHLAISSTVIWNAVNLGR